MHTISTIVKSALVLILLMGAAYSQNNAWPVRGEIDLASGFCDYRVAHFHGGVDIRTGGVEGREVYAPVDGYIWRIRYSYTGFGKALYLRDKAEFIYVFGHLSRLSDKLEKLVESRQYEMKRYYLDDEFESDSLPVKKGDLIAYSGQTGAGPPHLHFEKRTGDNKPLNPLAEGFPLPDKVPPTIEGVGFLFNDSCSLFSNGNRRFFILVKPVRGTSSYVLDTVPYFDAPFGLEVKASDKIRPGGPELNIFKASLYIDDYLFHEIEFDRYDYNETRLVDLCFDYIPASENNDFRTVLFQQSRLRFSGSKSQYQGGGVFPSAASDDFGLHKARIEVWDAAGNRSSVEFSFVYGPRINLVEVEQVDSSTIFLHPTPESQNLDLKGMMVFGAGSKGGWRALGRERVIPKGSFDYRVNLPSGKDKLKAYKIRIIGQSGWIKDEQYASPAVKGKVKYSLDYRLGEGGIFFKVGASEPWLSPPSIGIVYDDGYVGKIDTRPLSSSTFGAYYCDINISSKIIRFEVYDRKGATLAKKEVSIALAGGNELAEQYPDSGDFRISYSQKNFYSPIYVEISKAGGWSSKSKNMLTPVYKIEPEVQAVAEPVTLTFRYSGAADGKIGVCRDTKDGWVWTKSEFASGRIYAKSGLLGKFALIRDVEPPEIYVTYPGNRKIITQTMPEITCRLTDDLSGIEDDRGIVVHLDGQWLIPEYDPEGGILKTAPEKKLTAGVHQLEIRATDAAGNSRVAKSSFTVQYESKKGYGK